MKGKLGILGTLVLTVSLVVGCQQQPASTSVGELTRTSTELVLIEDCSQASSIYASPDLRRIAYTAKVSNKWFVVVDGQEGKQYDVVGSIAFSPDSKHFAYTGKVYTDGGSGKWFVVLDGVEGKQYDGVGWLTFSPDSKHVAYTAEVGDNWLMVLDGVEGTKYDNAAFPTFSPDSKRFAYVAEVGDNWLMVLDGVEGKQYDGGGVLFPTFGPDSRRLAYFAFVKPGHRWFVVVDGQEGKKYEISSVDETVAGFELVFSPDSKRIAYSGCKRITYSGTVDSPEAGDKWFVEKWFVVVDGQEGKQYDVVGSIAFSPDSKHFAYTAKVYTDGGSGKWFVVVDGQEGKQYDSVGYPTFSPDSKHVAYTANLGDSVFGGKCFVVVDGVEGKQYDGVAGVGWSYEYGTFIRSVNIVFDSSDSFRYVGREGNKVYLVKEKIR